MAKYRKNRSGASASDYPDLKTVHYTQRNLTCRTSLSRLPHSPHKLYQQRNNRYYFPRKVRRKYRPRSVGLLQYPNKRQIRNLLLNRLRHIKQTRPPPLLKTGNPPPFKNGRVDPLRRRSPPLRQPHRRTTNTNIPHFPPLPDAPPHQPLRGVRKSIGL